MRIDKLLMMKSVVGPWQGHFQSILHGQHSVGLYCGGPTIIKTASASRALLFVNCFHSRMFYRLQRKICVISSWSWVLMSSPHGVCGACVCMSVLCVYVWSCVYVHMCMNVPMHMCDCVCVCIHVCVCMCTWMCVFTCSYTATALSLDSRIRDLGPSFQLCLQIAAWYSLVLWQFFENVGLPWNPGVGDLFLE